MANNRILPISRHSVEELVNHMHDYLANDQGMETQRVHNVEGDFTILQARTRGGKFKKIVGLDKAVTLRFFDAPNAVNVEIGEAKWIDKSIVMTISMFVLWPLTVTSGVGIYKQKKLITDLTVEMDAYMGNTQKEGGKTTTQSLSEMLEVKSDEINCSSTMQHIVGNADKIKGSMQNRGGLVEQALEKQRDLNHY